MWQQKPTPHKWSTTSTYRMAFLSTFKLTSNSNKTYRNSQIKLTSNSNKTYINNQIKLTSNSNKTYRNNQIKLTSNSNKTYRNSQIKLTSNSNKTYRNNQIKLTSNSNKTYRNNQIMELGKDYFRGKITNPKFVYRQTWIFKRIHCSSLSNDSVVVIKTFKVLYWFI